MKLLYYTSTGNNLYISKELGSELLSIPQLMKNDELDIEDECVGIIFPVFFATSPKTVREFVKKSKYQSCLSVFNHFLRVWRWPKCSKNHEGNIERNGNPCKLYKFRPDGWQFPAGFWHGSWKRNQKGFGYWRQDWSD